jgi:D-serine deaminase-like pyridoxal phosphate-dependent protein
MSSSTSWTDWCTILQGSELPGLVVDLDAMKANLRLLMATIQSDAIAARLFVPELPCPALIREVLIAGGARLQGLTCMYSRDAAGLVDLGFDDILILIPVVEAEDALQIANLSRSHRVIVLVDEPRHLEVLQRAASQQQSTIRVCIDVDISSNAGDRVSTTQLSSPIQDSEQARILATAVEELDGLKLEGVLAREPSISAPSAWTRQGKKRARQAVLDRRLTLVQALRADGHAVSMVSAGRSRDLKTCTSDPAVSEFNLGEGLLGGVHAQNITELPLQEAAFIALPVVRRPDEAHVICGSMCSLDGPLQPILPLGLRSIPDHILKPSQSLMSLEALMPTLALGSPVLCHPEYPGRLMDHFAHIILVQNGTPSKALTLRGL